MQQILCVAFSQTHEWDSQNVIMTGSTDGVARVRCLYISKTLYFNISSTHLSKLEKNLFINMSTTVRLLFTDVVDGLCASACGRREI